MIILNKDEEETIKRLKALPLSVIERRIEEMKEELVSAKEEDFRMMQQFIKELKRWLVTVNMFAKPNKKKKLDDSI